MLVIVLVRHRSGAYNRTTDFRRSDHDHAKNIYWAVYNCFGDG